VHSEGDAVVVKKRCHVGAELAVVDTKSQACRECVIIGPRQHHDDMVEYDKVI